jgi:ribosomal protein L3
MSAQKSSAAIGEFVETTRNIPPKAPLGISLKKASEKNSGQILQQNRTQSLRDVSMFVEEEFVDVQGVSKGKVFKGCKRHGFGGVGNSRSTQPFKSARFCRSFLSI